MPISFRGATFPKRCNKSKIGSEVIHLKLYLTGPKKRHKMKCTFVQYVSKSVITGNRFDYMDTEEVLYLPQAGSKSELRLNFKRLRI